MKIVVRAPQWLGDAVVSTYFLSRLKEMSPEAELTVAAPSYLREVFAGHPAVSRFAALPNDKSFLASVSVLKSLSAETLYVLPRSARTGLEAWMSRIPKRVGFSSTGRSLLLTETIPYRSDLLYPHRYLNLIGDANLDLKGRRPYFPQEKTPLPNLPKPVLGLGPASIAPARTWPKENFLAVAKAHLSSTSGSVILFGSSKEAAVTGFLKNALGDRAVDTAGRLTLPQLGGVLSECDQFVCNDSGLMHVAAAVGTPTVVIFGASDPTYALPALPGFGFLQSKKLECVPCLRNRCGRTGDTHLGCLTQISSEQAIDALQKLG